jgi:hypothetical protein
MTPEPRSVEEALEHLADGIAVDACDQCSSDLALLRSEIERLRGIEEAPRHVTALRVGIDWHEHEGMVTAYYADGRYAGCMGIKRWGRLLREDAAALARPDRQEEGE